jgi:glycine oxidase
MKGKTIIIGGGVAGICLAYQLFKRNLPFLVIDNLENHSSKVAAGLINPMVFRRMNKSWMIDEEMAELQDVYKALEKLTGVSFFRPLPFRRVFASIEEAELWDERLQHDEYKPYMEFVNVDDENFTTTFNEYGTARVSLAFAVDGTKFIEASHAWLKAINCLKIEKFDLDKISLEKKEYNSIGYDQIVFCQGYQNINNPFFKYLPIDPTKGEVLDVEIQALETEELLNRKCWLMPVLNSNKMFRLGATYAWDTTDLTPTVSAREDLLAKANSLVKYPITLIDHKTGIRPTTPDRRPILGAHNLHKDLYIFNGLGTKGYCHAPYWAEQLFYHIFENKELHPEVRIGRFKKKWLKELENSALKKE